MTRIMGLDVVFRIMIPEVIFRVSDKLAVSLYWRESEVISRHN
jgi:hypothetical protein